MSDAMFPRAIPVSHETFWCLKILSRARRNTASPMDSPPSVNMIADEILRQHIHAHFPYLEDIYAKRQKADQEAVDRLQHPL